MRGRKGSSGKTQSTNTVTYCLHRLAERDLEEAFEFYLKQGSGKVALRFLAEFERVAELIDSNPEIGTQTNADRRAHPFRKYPYWLIYKSTDAGVRILVVRHKRRAQEYGSNRS